MSQSQSGRRQSASRPNPAERRPEGQVTEGSRTADPEPAPEETLAEAVSIEVSEEVVLTDPGSREPPGGGGYGGGHDGGDEGEGPTPDGSPHRPFNVRLTRSSEDPLERREVALWEVIDQSTQRLSFMRYMHFLDSILSPHGHGELWHGIPRREPRYKLDSAYPRPYSVYGSDAYDLVKAATTVFMMQETGTLLDLEWFRTRTPMDQEALDTVKNDYATIVTDGELIGRIAPYLELIREKLRELPVKAHFTVGTSPHEYGILRGRVDTPTMIELIWSYWLEWGMLVQTMNAIALRFQNKRTGYLPDPLVNLALDPLRPLANLIWGWVRDEASRLTLGQRAYEYEQEYGLSLVGPAVPNLRTVERRSRFIECFHNLLGECIRFFRERDDLTVRADGFPLLNSLSDVHLVLAQGAVNQFLDLPWVARQEMMVMQWLLARPEFREFLGGRIAVPYPEPWMDRVDSMRTLQNWGDVSITSFHYLAHYGEQILLTIRYGNWSQIHDAGTAAAWADRWRPQIQSYVHHYRLVTGVDLGAEVVNGRDAQDRYLPPEVHIIRRLAEQHGTAIPPPASVVGIAARSPSRSLIKPRPAKSVPVVHRPGSNGI